MKILAIDTATAVSTVALLDEDRVLSEIIINSKKNHSEKLMTLTHEVISTTDYTIKDIDLFACSIGPGSFTGLRIAIATIKGLAQGLNKPVIGVSTLESLAFNIQYNNGIVCPIIDAQRDEVYCGMYRWDNNKLIAINDERVININDLLYELHSLGERVTLIGDGIFKIPDDKINGLLQKSHISFRMPRASSIANIALLKYKGGIIQNYHEIEPNYIRKSQAEVQLELKQNKL